jgi:hypothetical protein
MIVLLMKLRFGIKTNIEVLLHSINFAALAATRPASHPFI